MTRKQFLDAADRGQPVRLKDRSRCFYEDEWYHPYAAPDGRLAIATHTGEHHDVDDTLLEALTDEIPPLTVADIASRGTPGRRGGNRDRDRGSGRQAAGAGRVQRGTDVNHDNERRGPRSRTAGARHPGPVAARRRDTTPHALNEVRGRQSETTRRTSTPRRAIESRSPPSRHRPPTTPPQPAREKRTRSSWSLPSSRRTSVRPVHEKSRRRRNPAG